jgi:hypothetical protein
MALGPLRQAAVSTEEGREPADMLRWCVRTIHSHQARSSDSTVTAGPADGSRAGLRLMARSDVLAQPSDERIQCPPRLPRAP